LKTVVLASGGIDSSVLMLLLRRERVEILPVHINYGQLAEPREWPALKRFCAVTRLPNPIMVNASGLGLVPSGLTRRATQWKSDPFFPGRNLILAAMGASVGYSRGCRTIALGLVANTLYADATKEFVRVASDALSESFGARMLVTAPLLRFNKREVVELGKASHAPLSLTYSCQLGTSSPCGRCSSCRDRIAAFEGAPKSGAEAYRTTPKQRRVRAR
jgi:7-cyano-7-deazaguanine synthase